MKLLLDNTTILVTGASSGMGKALAKNLILVARREKELDAFAEELKSDFSELCVYSMPCDLADPDAVQALTNKIHHEFVHVDILINAAGVGQTAFLENVPMAEIERLVQLNVISLTHLCNAFLPAMIERGCGGILNFSSYFGLKILPGYTVYAGSKHYVTRFTEALRAQVAGTGVVVSCVYPAPIQTDFWNTSNAELLRPPSFLFISMKQCVRETLKGFRKGRARIVPELRIRLFLALLAVTPAFIERMINASIARILQSKQKQMNLSSSEQIKSVSTI